MSGCEIRFAGAGGQGLQLCAKLLSAALAREGRIVAATQAYEPTSRGGLSRSDMVVSTDGAADYPLVTALDYLVILDQTAVAASEPLLRDGTLVLADARRVTAPPKGGKGKTCDLRRLPFSEAAIRLGSERVANVIALSALVGMTGLCSREGLEQAVRGGTPAKLLDRNLDALREGFAMADNRAEVA
ncbi:MAG: 2-oxoacid:acceptor oxidoreductase family protein [Rhodospirillales bacterium]|nr:MAG: 2-oxoacid:acceptor oxidoreductase family protein [Rhodospirillales bacterium]